MPSRDVYEVADKRYSRQLAPYEIPDKREIQRHVGPHEAGVSRFAKSADVYETPDKRYSRQLDPQELPGRYCQPGRRSRWRI
jgi:hypothetical protein